jgi:hypothetical protein
MSTIVVESRQVEVGSLPAVNVFVQEQRNETDELKPPEPIANFQPPASRALKGENFNREKK